ncbi:MAG: hypothetical protein U5K56_15645 [Halioglobus sp.]|nr:hypothetical protein [Halioglobus sp.]
MDAVLTLVAILLPVLLGSAWINLLVPADTPARGALVWGNGALFGVMVTPLLMRALHATGLPLDFMATALAAVALTAMAALIHLRGHGRGRTSGQAAPARAMPTAQRVLWTILLGLIVLRLITLGTEVALRPLFPWDATMHWATKARVWFEHRSLVPFVPHDIWLQVGGEGVYTDRHPNYPSMIPLLQVWMNLATGNWNESLMNLPWVVCLAGLGAAFYGHLRVARVEALTAAAFTYFLMSMPLINIHVALAGYADIYLAAAFCCALMALHNWMTLRAGWMAALALLFAALCPQIKNEGLFWALSLAPAALVAFMQRRQAAKVLLLLGLLAILLLLLLPRHLVIAGHSMEELVPAFQPEALAGLVKIAWLHANWHLFGYMLLILLPLGLLMPGALTRKYLGLTTALTTAIGAFLFLFLFTGFGRRRPI